MQSERALRGSISQREPTADETGGLEDLLLPLLLAPQVGEGVDDDAKDEVEHDDDDHEEEEQVVHHSGCEQRLLRWQRKATLVSNFDSVAAPEPQCWLIVTAAAHLFGGSPEEVTHASTVTQTLVQHRDDAHEQGVTHVLDPVVYVCGNWDRVETEESDWSASAWPLGSAAAGPLDRLNTI